MCYCFVIGLPDVRVSCPQQQDVRNLDTKPRFLSQDDVIEFGSFYYDAYDGSKPQNTSNFQVPRVRDLKITKVRSHNEYVSINCVGGLFYIYKQSTIFFCRTIQAITKL